MAFFCRRRICRSGGSVLQSGSDMEDVHAQIQHMVFLTWTMTPLSRWLIARYNWYNPFIDELNHEKKGLSTILASGNQMLHGLL